MTRRLFLRCLAVLPLVPFLHAPAPESLEPHFHGWRTGEKAIAYSTGPSKWLRPQCAVIYPNGRLRLIPITTGRFTA